MAKPDDNEWGGKIMDEQTEFSNSVNYLAIFQWLSLSLSKQLEVPNLLWPKKSHEFTSCSLLHPGSFFALPYPLSPSLVIPLYSHCTLCSLNLLTSFLLRALWQPASRMIPNDPHLMIFMSLWNMRKGGRAQTLKEWLRHRTLQKLVRTN